ncbi:hypothetical protein JR316_0007547 [Psilocybe cubensis]|uniref:Uncharacterized protein n=2 Tax=Psilocybe cubensis TaxID=181762 RepID=A0ACB8GYW6_PSICU|nr:hypothetical protein JR316_0007547 [Psilocybe cubensis]KAH9480940.1 hypothetical protein JR316_0007547 [Psilocybe cubensis]
MESTTGGFISISLGETTHSSVGDQVGMPVFASADDVNAGTDSEAQTKMTTRRGTINAVSVVSTNADAGQDGYANIKVEKHVTTVV